MNANLHCMVPTMIFIPHCEFVYFYTITTGISYFAVCHGGRQRHEWRTAKAFAISRGRQKAPAK